MTRGLPWGVDEGDQLLVSGSGIRPQRHGGLHHFKLDDMSRAIAVAAVGWLGRGEVRYRIMSILARCEAQGVWLTAYTEWRAIASTADDGALLATMLGRDEESKWVRQRAPYAGLRSQEQERALDREASG